MITPGPRDVQQRTGPGLRQSNLASALGDRHCFSAPKLIAKSHTSQPFPNRRRGCRILGFADVCWVEPDRGRRGTSTSLAVFSPAYFHSPGAFDPWRGCRLFRTRLMVRNTTPLLK